MSHVVGSAGKHVHAQRVAHCRERRGRQMRGVAGRAHLIAHDPHCLAFTPEPQHRVEEIPAARVVDPRGSEDQVAGARLLDKPVTLELRSSVRVEGAGGVVFAPGRGAGAGVDVVGRVVKEGNAARPAPAKPSLPAPRR